MRLCVIAIALAGLTVPAMASDRPVPRHAAQASPLDACRAAGFVFVPASQPSTDPCAIPVRDRPKARAIVREAPAAPVYHEPVYDAPAPVYSYDVAPAYEPVFNPLAIPFNILHDVFDPRPRGEFRRW